MEFDNSLQEKLSENNPVFGAQAISATPSIVEVCGEAGMDFIWIDLEHTGPSPLDSRAMTSLVRSAECAGTELLVRPHDPDPHVIRKILDTGVRNLILPRVETAEEVEEAIEAARFIYDGEPGKRGSSVSRVNNWGHAEEGFSEREDVSVVVGAMIENIAAVENIEEILNVSDLDFVRIGYGDLSVSLGSPIQTDHSEVIQAAEYVESVAKEYGVHLSRKANSPEAIIEALDNDYRILTVGSDFDILRSTLEERYPMEQR
jgi:2-keto-3-deoxy-L-rhamnonate aldolase RhmA